MTGVLEGGFCKQARLSWLWLLVPNVLLAPISSGIFGFLERDNPLTTPFAKTPSAKTPFAKTPFAKTPFS